jgi:hypothetical protein
MQQIVQFTVTKVTELPDGNVNVEFDDGTGASWVTREDFENEVNRRLEMSANSLMWLAMNQYIQTSQFPTTATLNTNEPNGNVVKVT